MPYAERGWRKGPKLALPWKWWRFFRGWQTGEGFKRALPNAPPTSLEGIDTIWPPQGRHCQENNCQIHRAHNGDTWPMPWRVLRQRNKANSIWANVPQLFDDQSSSYHLLLVVAPISILYTIFQVFIFWFACYSTTTFYNHTLNFYQILFRRVAGLIF